MKHLINKNMFMILCPLFILCAMTLPAAADESQTSQPVKQLIGEEIIELLSGNSAIYEDGAKQFFYADGLTFYQEPGGPQSRGTWRATEDQYCSRWGFAGRPSPEACYTMEDDNGRITWNQKYPAKIQAGNVLD